MIYIHTKIKDGAWGGGNQFIKALRRQLMAKGLYSEDPDKADVLLFNSYQDIFELVKSFFRYKSKKIVYRLGPIFHLHRGLRWIIVDWIVIFVANLFVDLIIFQSDWSYCEALKLGLSKKKKFKVILNGVDGDIFYSAPKKDRKDNQRVNLIYTSWSSNANKGFSFLEFLDKNLDFDRFRLRFIGNSLVTFKRIDSVPALSSVELATELRNSDVYISPAKYDACSNAILEALACGLPVVALDSGSNSELVKEGGVLFKDEETLLSGLEDVARDLDFYRDRIVSRSITQVCDEYVAAVTSM